MRETLNVALSLVATILLAFMAGLLTGTWIYERAMRFAGHKPPPLLETVGAMNTRAPVNTELSAQRAITRDSIERGADEIQANAEGQGVKIGRKEAREQAAQMLSMMDPLGGAR